MATNSISDFMAATGEDNQASDHALDLRKPRMAASSISDLVAARDANSQASDHAFDFIKPQQVLVRSITNCVAATHEDNQASDHALDLSKPRIAASSISEVLSATDEDSQASDYTFDFIKPRQVLFRSITNCVAATHEDNQASDHAFDFIKPQQISASSISDLVAARDANSQASDRALDLSKPRMLPRSITDGVAAADEDSQASDHALDLSKPQQFGRLEFDLNADCHLNSTTANSNEHKLMTAAEQSLCQKFLRTRVVIDPNEKYDIFRKDPTAPYFYSRTFEELNLRPDLLKAIHAMGYHIPSKIQEGTLPLMLSYPPQNLIAQSHSGTGKTVAILLAILGKINPTQKYPQALLICPTYELALQTGQVIRNMATYCRDISIIYAIHPAKEVYILNVPLTEHVIIGTPGAVMDWAFQSKIFDITQINVFALDEADVVFATDGLKDYCTQINRELGPSCQRLLFSATCEPEFWMFAEKIVPNAVIIASKIEAASEESYHRKIMFCFVKCPGQEEKYKAIASIYAAFPVGGTLVFCQTSKTVAWLAQKLRQDGHCVALLSDDSKSSQRVTVLRRFKDSTEKIIVTTYVMARVIDVEAVSLVVNFDMPVDFTYHPDYEAYIHRIVRTGRCGDFENMVAMNLIEEA